MADPDIVDEVLAKRRNRSGRPTREQAKKKLEAQLAAPLPHYSHFMQPVGVTFLANIMSKQPKQIQKRLEKCPVMRWDGPTKPQYDFMTAMSYLVPPRGNIEDWFGQQNAASLPPYVNKMWWDSANQRNRVMLSSNDLWHTDDVMVVFGRARTLIHEHTKMWVENLPEKDILTTEQYGALVDATNKLVDELREILVNQPRQTLSMTDHIRSELDASGTTPQGDIPEESDDE